MSYLDRSFSKRVLILCATVFAMLFVAVGTASAAGTPAPPDSYLNTKVYSIDQLIQQVQSNPRIELHYAETFHVPSDRVVQYIRNNVVESYIQETGAYTVYCVRPNGLIYPTVQHFSRGTKVFALRNGQPVMKWACGNPLMNFLPAVHEVIKPVVKTIVKVSPSVETLVPTQPAEEQVPVEEVAPVYQPKVPVMASPISFTSPISAAAGHISPFALLPLAFLPTFGNHGGGGGGKSTTGGTTSGSTTSGSTTSGSTTSGSTTSGTTTSGAVPEPGSGSTLSIGFILLAIGALVASTRKSSRRSS